MKNRTNPSEAGLTLVELLVSAALVAIGAGAVSALLSSAFVRSDTNSAQTHAGMLAAREMESLRAQDYTTLASRTAPNSPDRWTGLSFAINSGVTRDTPAPNLSTIVVTVDWSQRGRAYNYVLRSVYADTRQ